MAVRVALLRGVNVGRHRRIAMAELRELLSGAEYGHVRTLGQSGNVVFDSSSKPPALERALRELLGVEVLVRTAAELEKVLAHDPLGDVARNGSRYLVTFLSAAPPAAAVRELAAAAIAPERLVAHGRELYSWHPRGLSDSQLANALASAKLGVTSTARNWNTVTKLCVLTRDTSVR